MNNNYRTYVWSFLGRISHWLLVISLFSCFITSFYEELLTLHVSIGIVVFGMLMMKIVWGVIGPKYARWSDFKFALKDLKFYFVEKIRNRYRTIQPGHNPASSWFAFLVTWFGIICCTSGFLLYGIQEGNGIFSSLNEKYISKSEILDSTHIFLAYLLLVMIFAHVSGVLIEQFYHKTNMVMAMVSGYKKAKGEDITTTFRMKLLGSLYIIGVLIIAVYSYCTPNNMFTKSKFEKISYKELDYDFYFECSDCHNLFPPFLLPANSWTELMKNQHEHFEEDLELDESLVKKINSYLVTNSADKSTKESAYNLNREINNSKLYTITKTNYWKQIHKDIPEKIFENDIVEKKSNCVACHKGFEQGIIFDINITYPPKVTKK
ncbi:cytochrome b/b6 domain-containing protein [Halarcobacter sp.]|uniref:cytochrome b/b6 domain-containing protein n=1 Tax=Halarcobacter sp. TaxID=2321133 RepID=UPI0029F4D565|nr:cytochrome b/b6 domain-containing protein [Halarcobacter sp.]